ncbi:hypothetical protein FACS189490_10660 [Clostridia bacterium]|nr:hypothetical protein FACS189490_10660 [Clostridia bacterium]
MSDALLFLRKELNLTDTEDVLKEAAKEIGANVFFANPTNAAHESFYENAGQESFRILGMFGAAIKDDDTLLCALKKTEFSRDDIIILHACRLQAKQPQSDFSHSREAVLSAINALTYSELLAAQSFLTAQNSNGIVVFAEVARECGFAKSVVTTAAKKLECAWLIETRSLGAKGTKITVKSEQLLTEIKKLK